MIQSGAYDDHNGDPHVVLVFSGTHDVSRALNLLSGATPNCEHVGMAEQVRKQVRRHNGGRTAMRLLAQHGGPDFLATVGQSQPHTAGCPDPTVHDGDCMDQPDGER